MAYISLSRSIDRSIDQSINLSKAAWGLGEGKVAVNMEQSKPKRTFLECRNCTKRVMPFWNLTRSLSTRSYLHGQKVGIHQRERKPKRFFLRQRSCTMSMTVVWGQTRWLTRQWHAKAEEGKEQNGYWTRVSSATKAVSVQQRWDSPPTSSGTIAFEGHCTKLSALTKILRLQTPNVQIHRINNDHTLGNMHQNIKHPPPTYPTFSLFLSLVKIPGSSEWIRSPGAAMIAWINMKV